MVLGHWVEMRSISQAQGAVKELAKLLPDTAVRIVGDRMETVAVSDLRVGDVVRVRQGARIPVFVLHPADGADRSGITRYRPLGIRRDNPRATRGKHLPLRQLPADRRGDGHR